MARANVETEALRQFAAELSRFVSDATALRTKLVTAHRRVGDTWNDQVYQKVSAEIDQAMRNLDAFLKQVEPEVPKIKKKIEALEQYLG